MEQMWSSKPDKREYKEDGTKYQDNGKTARCQFGRRSVVHVVDGKRECTTKIPKRANDTSDERQEKVTMFKEKTTC